MTYKVGAKGQVVLPKELRDEFHIRPGDEVEFDKGDGDIRVRKAQSKADAVRRLRGLLRDSPTDVLAEHEAEHRREVEEDEREMRERGLR
jgi:AbrB family looped-hinge helix DNA binding protein